MTEEELIKKIMLLPPELKAQVETFVDFIMEQKKIQPEVKQRKSGQLKGKVWMSPDFDEPLEDMKDYM